jgi:CRP-like cAMP-binding protein
MSFSNRMLRALSAPAAGSLRPWLEPVSIRPEQVVYRMGDPVEHVYFVERGLLARVATIEDGRSVGVGMIGREGCAGAFSAVARRPSYHQVTGHVPVEALRMEAARFVEAVNGSRELRAIVDAYTDALVTSSELMATCFAFHPLAARLSTTLLNAYDASGEETLMATQELLASLFAVQRTSVTSLATSLERQGLIRTGRGLIELKDRGGLERLACGCYTRQAQLWAELWDAGPARA